MVNSVYDNIDKFEVYMIETLNVWQNKMLNSSNEDFSYLSMNVYDELLQALCEYRKYKD